MFKSKYDLTIGTDPEVCTTIEKGGKNLVISPALLEKFSGLKEIKDRRPEEESTKHPFYIKTNNFIWMMDGVSFEATIKPAKTPTELYEKIQLSLNHLNEKIGGLDFKGTPLKLYKKPVVDIEPDMYLPYLDEEKILQGFIFGCDPDEDAIIPNYKCEEINVEEHLYRYLGGHFHIGSENESIKSDMRKVYMPFIRLLAIFVGNVSIAFSDFPEEEKKRAETYGKPGRFRFQPHGLEYRSPSNSWISNPETPRLMFEGAEKAMYYLQNPKEGVLIIKNYLNPTIDSIQTGDSKMAMEILEEVLI